jgi:hypothetical protein
MMLEWVYNIYRLERRDDMKSLLNADIEQRKSEGLMFYSTTFNLIMPLAVPAALGAVFPPIAVAWWVLGTLMAMFLGSPLWIVPMLVILYLSCSVIVWVGMVIVRRKYPQYGHRY